MGSAGDRRACVCVCVCRNPSSSKMGLLFVILSVIFMKGGTVKDGESPCTILERSGSCFPHRNLVDSVKNGRGSRSRTRLLATWNGSDSGVCRRCHLEHSEEAARSARVSARLREQRCCFLVVSLLFCSGAAEKDTQSSAR